jgi:activator of HSP90 ATPase
MAKWGEGDPRWIVEERPDATNVNNWHWTEKNATPWSKDKLQELLKDFVIVDDKISCSISSIDKLEGEATANNRKGKLIFFYEWNIVLKWTGSLPGQATPTTGKITVPNLSEENDIDEVEVTVTIDESNDDSEKLKQIMYNCGRDKIREQLSKYVKSLKEDFAKNLILPKKDDVSANVKVKPDQVVNLTSGFNKQINVNAGSEPTPAKPAAAKPLGVKLEVQTIEFTQTFQCKASDLYNVFVDVSMVTAFTRGHVKLDATKNGEFVLFGGNIRGKFNELVPGKKITQSWRYKPWPADHYSQVTLNFNDKEDHTELHVVQTGVPKAEVEATRQNWHRYYFDSIRSTFGFGSFLY